MWGYGPEWGMMGGWGGFGWLGPLHILFWVVVLILIVALIVWLVRPSSHASVAYRTEQRRSPGLDVLEERYARGEINRDEYLQKRRDIAG
jgi:putative membrane protein